MLFDKKIECSNCGKTISSKDTFCPNCGKINLDLDGHDFSIISKNKLSGVFTKKCPNCNSAIDRDTLYCPSCGKLVMNLDGYDFSLPIKKIRFSTPTKRCEYCGSTINRNALFCDGCGGVNVNLDGHDFSFINNEETKNENKKLKKKLSLKTDTSWEHVKEENRYITDDKLLRSIEKDIKELELEEFYEKCKINIVRIIIINIISLIFIFFKQ